MQAANALIEENFIDALPFHFVAHLLFAVEVLGYCHPDLNLRKAWFSIYVMIAKSMHLNVETFTQFSERLQDDEVQTRREDVYDLRCFATGNYGDGTGTVNEEHR